MTEKQILEEKLAQMRKDVLLSDSISKGESLINPLLSTSYLMSSKDFLASLPLEQQELQEPNKK
ncbi:hypothetical protein [Mariniflexile sp. AS56]|uniref:hypothetical protein n=1 Tax=Mariniflexile sp. AS56 TaxID=3063957 RepID=UPI0026EC413E|nr:hypothetical protein [Mariniflexile sp. AS56]MDO7172037.1 hypothetical protein [Mariniflexile sp. AS56]